jgi:hypothetical protein
MKRIVSVVIVGALGLTWWLQYQATERLTQELARLQADQRDLAALRQRREELRLLQPPERDASADWPVPAAAPAPLPIATGATSPGLSLGDWRSASAWRNQGRGSPGAVIETTLWAAAGGDLGTLAGLLALAPEAREKAEVLRLKLPQAERYGSAEELVAACMINAIPVGEAQLVMLNEADAEHAVAGLFLRNPPTAAGAVEFAKGDGGPDQAAAGSPPPQLKTDARTMVAYLALQRTGDSWQLIVPAHAIDRIAGADAPRRPR